jgi:hypothetical protein
MNASERVRLESALCQLVATNKDEQPWTALS